MASTTTINAWTEELVRSFLPAKTRPTKAKRLIEHFSRTVKHHNYGRTNQYDVEDRLTGLEEKFQVLNNDELSDALRNCRSELKEYQHRWLPDVLDLLLQLSIDPVKKTRLSNANLIEERTAAPTRLSWSDIEADDPIDRNDEIWKQPTYGESSSDEDEYNVATDATSPASTKSTKSKGENQGRRDIQVAASPDTKEATAFRNQLFKLNSKDKTVVSEIAAVREVLFMVQGLPTTIFQLQGGSRGSRVLFKLAHLSEDALEAACSPLFTLRAARDRLQQWVDQPHDHKLLQTLETEMRKLLNAFDHGVSDLHSQTIGATQTGGMISFLATVDSLRARGSPITTVARFIARTADTSQLGYMDSLFDCLNAFDCLNDDRSFEALHPAFQSMFAAYGTSLAEWVESGNLTTGNDYFFIQKAHDSKDKARLWHSWYTHEMSGSVQPPRFLASLAEQIFIAGKTRAFLSLLGAEDPLRPGVTPPASLNSMADSFCQLHRSLLPFSMAFGSMLSTYVASHLHHNSMLLRAVLLQQHALSPTLQSLSNLYLASSSITTSLIDHHTFDGLLRCSPDWNDRFLLADLISTALPTIPQERLVVHSTRLSTSSLRQPRNTIKVLENFAIDFILPCSIANIISSDTLSSYRRVSLLLSQIRYAKYALEKHSYPHLGTLPKPTQALLMNLHVFVNTLYSHFTTCVIAPLTVKLQPEIIEGGTVDEMISLHETYLQKLEYGCLTVKTLKILHDTVISILDICLAFGMSATILDLDGEAVTKTKRQFKKHVDFLIAGLKGVARGSEAGSRQGDGTGAAMELLADRLQAAGFK